MKKKPTYDELARRVRELEAENARLKQNGKALKREKSRHVEAEQMALLGHWELDLVSNKLYWSEEIFHIFNLDPNEFGATYEAFLGAIHPHDRDYVDNEYKTSLAEKRGYDIVHRLLLKDGSVKYVQEKCKTDYDENGNPIRSLGTVQDITSRVRAGHTFAGMIGRDLSMLEVFESIKELAGANVSVLIQGESGTGKELVARAIHNEGSREGGPFVPINCSALPEGLLESELFGHVRGAFTGALRDKKGRFELADRGTLFLDEVADLSKMLQVKLLRVLQEGTFERVGGEKTVTVDVRIISAANRDLRAEVAAGNFREDLFYRLAVVPIYLPALRERINDIPLLVEFFLEKAARDGQHTKGIDKRTLDVMVDYYWPGNVRELQSALQFSLIKAKGGVIEPHHLPPDLLASTTAGTRTKSSPPSMRYNPGDELFKMEKAGCGGSKKRKLDMRSVEEALSKTGGNKVKAAKLLGVGRATLYRYLDKNSLK